MGADGAGGAEAPAYCPGAPLPVLRMVACGFGSEADCELVVRRLRESATSDPAIETMEGSFDLARVVAARRRRDIVADAVWYRSPYVEEVHAQLGVDDALYSSVPGETSHLGIVLWRTCRSRPFDEAERDLLLAFHRAAVPLYDRVLRKESEATRRARSIPPRLRRTLRALLSGQSQKEVARALGLSPHTIHEYIAHVYAHFGVASRAELLARFIRPEDVPPV